MNLRVVRADPAGNITLFVLDAVSREQRAAIAARLMQDFPFQAEQVGFVCSPTQGGAGRMEMMGGEFCGNATRAYGMLVSREMNPPPAQVLLEVSGCEHLVRVDVDFCKKTARSQMPLPLFTRKCEINGGEGTLVHLGGIAHLVVQGIKPSEEFFLQVEPMFTQIPNLDAYGVIFLDSAGEGITPLVKVPSLGTLVWEGSCGSGSLAAAVALSAGQTDGVFIRELNQPAGTIQAQVKRASGAVVAAAIGGDVELGEVVEVILS